MSPIFLSFSFPFYRLTPPYYSVQFSGSIIKWYDLFPDPTIADAIMDRVIHNSYILALDSQKSMREVIAEKTLKNLEKNDPLE